MTIEKKPMTIAEEFSRHPSWYPIDPELLKKYLRDHRYSVHVYQRNMIPGTRSNNKMHEEIKDDFSFYPDSSYFFNLVIASKTVACIGFRIVTKTSDEDNTRGKVVLIEQIQGRANSREQLKLVKWERLLIEIVIEWARKRKMVEVRVINAHIQKYWPEKSTTIENFEKHIARTQEQIAKGVPPPAYYPRRYWHEELKRYENQLQEHRKKCHRFKMHYNVTPKRMGFKQVKGQDYRVLEL